MSSRLQNILSNNNSFNLMIVDKSNSNQELDFQKGNLKFAVVGHVEWINFLKVDQLPKSGNISHAQKSYEQPAGGGSLIANTLLGLTNQEVHFFTSLGNDDYGNQCFELLSKKGIRMHVAWRNQPTRSGFSLIDNLGERAITVIGERLAPIIKDSLDWDILEKMDGVFITAADSEIFKKARKASTLCTTPRAGISVINKSNILLDSIIGSNLDPGEVFSLSELTIQPKYTIKTEGKDGGIVFPGGRYQAFKNKNPNLDSYGCGDSFAAGILYGLSSKWTIDKSLILAKILGRNASEYFGPYSNEDMI